MVFSLDARSLKNLEGVHPDLIKVVTRAIEISPVNFTVVEGLRTLDQERRNVARGASQTLHSRHLDGHAVDIWAVVDGKAFIDWTVAPVIAFTMKKAAAELSIPIEWGGDWTTLKDGPHFQLPWKEYPS